MFTIVKAAPNRNGTKLQRVHDSSYTVIHFPVSWAT